MPRVWAQATPAMATVPAVTLASPFGVSIRLWTLIGASSTQPRRDPVLVELVERRQLDLGQPLGGRDVAVQAGHDQPRRVAVLERQRLAVHADRDQGVAAVEGGDGEAARVPVDGAADDLVGAGVDPGLVEQVVEPHAEPAGVADQLAADLVRDARRA